MPIAVIVIAMSARTIPAIRSAARPLIDWAGISGLRLLPLVVGLLVTSVGAGTAVGRTGRYKIFPLAGTVVIGIGLFLLSRMTEHTSTVVASLFMLVLGAGIGLSMQVLTLIVQNTSAYADLAVATSGVTFFRTLGGSFGASVFGSLYANSCARACRERSVPRG